MLIQIPEAFLPLMAPKRFKVLSGGRGSGKTESIARALLLKASEQRHRILCGRELQNSISESVHQVLKDVINQYSLPGFEVYDSYILNTITGSDFLFKGIRHNTQEIKSMKGVTIAWFEEAQGLTKDSLDIIIPTIREENSELWFSYNRSLPEDPVHAYFVDEFGNAKDSATTWYSHTTFRDNPFFPMVLRDAMEKCKITRYSDYLHIWEGGPKLDGGDVIKTEWFLWTTDIPQSFDFTFITADTAYKEKKKNDPKKDPDYTCFFYWGVKDKRLYLIDFIREQKAAVDIEAWSEPWIRSKLRYGFRYIWIEDKGQGIALNQSFRRKGLPIPDEETLKKTMKRHINKVERCSNAMARVDQTNKNVIINANIDQDKLRALKDEMIYFPNNQVHDDTIDCLADGIVIGLGERDYVSEYRRMYS